jgi:hypothetical protein
MEMRKISEKIIQAKTKKVDKLVKQILFIITLALPMRIQ